MPAFAEKMGVFSKRMVGEKNMNREQLKQRIEELPLFEKRDVMVSDGKGNHVDAFHKAVCEVGDEDAHTYAYVTPSYYLMQMNQVFGPILESISGDVDGYISHFGGFALMKFFPEDDILKDGENRFGLVAMNSVDQSSSIIVKFCVENGKHQITIPPKVAGLKKQHSGRIGNIVKDYVSMIGKVKDLWGRIIQEFPEYVVVRDAEKDSRDKVVELGTMCEMMKVGSRISKELEEAFKTAEKNGKDYTLWDAFTRTLEIVSSKEYKSPVHKEKKIDAICQAVFDYAAVLSI